MTMDLIVRSPVPIIEGKLPDILWGGIVHLEVENPPDDWQTAGYTITWYANDSVIDPDHLKIIAGDRPTVQWDTSNVLRPLSRTEAKRVTVTVEFKNEGRDGDGSKDLVGSFFIDLYDLPKVQVEVSNRDQSRLSVVEGQVVRLGASLMPNVYPLTHPNDPDRAEAPTINAADFLETSRIKLRWKVDERSLPYKKTDDFSTSWDTTGAPLGTHLVKAVLVNEVFDRPLGLGTEGIEVLRRPLTEGNTLPVTLQRAAAPPTRDQALWVAIRNRTKAIAFSGSGYKDFIDAVLCDTPPSRSFGSLTLDRQRTEYGQVRRDHTSGATTKIVAGVGAYELLKTATEAFLLLNCGVAITERDISSGELLYTDTDEATRLGTLVSITEITNRLTDYLGGNPGRLPYIKTIIKNAFPDMEPSDQVHCDGFLVRSRVDQPCLLELIWSYWHEEGMLVQTMNAISRRFQNLRSGGGQDPLAHLEIDPIRPLNNLLWGYIQDEQHRLTVQRRAYEYDHQYGMTLYGKAVPPLQSADSRSKFLEAYHNLLHLCTVFYLEDDDTTRIADAFQLLNALKETHLLLALGATNQFGDLQWTARAEMLMQQWLLGRSEMRDFLQSRPMVPYQEGWMAQVDAVKKLKGWTDVSVMHFHELGVYGEQILLSVRYGDWINVNDPAQAANWARYWRPEIQSYMHAYRAVTGVDLAPAVTSPQELSLRRMPPSALLRQRLEGGAVPMLPAASSASVAAPQGFRARRATPRS